MSYINTSGYQQNFREEFLDSEELVKVLQSLQELYLAQQDSLAEKMFLYDQKVDANKSYLAEAQEKIDKMKLDTVNILDNLKHEQVQILNNYIKEISSLRAQIINVTK